MHITDTSFCCEKGTIYAFITQEDALSVINRIYKILDTSGCVTVRDFRKIIGDKCEAYGDEIYGWTALDNMTLFRVSTNNGYEWHIKIPMVRIIYNTPQFKNRYQSINKRYEPTDTRDIRIADAHCNLEEVIEDLINQGYHYSDPIVVKLRETYELLNK